MWLAARLLPWRVGMIFIPAGRSAYFNRDQNQNGRNTSTDRFEYIGNQSVRITENPQSKTLIQQNHCWPSENLLFGIAKRVETWREIRE